LESEYNEIQTLHKKLENKLGRKISEFDDDIFWDEITKKLEKKGLLSLTLGYSGSDIERGTRVALLKAINTELLTYDIFRDSLKLVGGTATHVERQDILSNEKILARRTRNSKEQRKDLPSPPEI
jgi:SpoVK/Ycf46/Vps4 family AAA+-type ATPase